MAYQVKVLSLPKSDRSKHLLAQGTALGLEMSLCLGIDGNLIPDQSFNSFAPQKAAEFLLGRRIGKNELACVLGHLNIYKDFVQNSLDEWCLVLEDDAKLEPKVMQFLELESQFPRKSIIHLSPQNMDSEMRLKKKLLTSKESCFEINKLLDFVPRTHAYLIDRQAAKIAIRNSRTNKFYFTADWPLSWIRKVDFWVTTENLSDVLDLGSNIADERHAIELETTHQTLMKRISRMRFVNWMINGFGFSSIYGRLIGIPANVTYRELFIIPFKARLLKSPLLKILLVK